MALRSHNVSDEHVTWIQLDGVKDILNCPQGDVGRGVHTYIGIKQEDKEMLSVLLSAYMSKVSVQVIFDNTDFVRGVCRATSVTLRM